VGNIPNFFGDFFARRVQACRTIPGINIPPTEMVHLLEKMQLSAQLFGQSTISVIVPPTRSDIFHACDVMEDVAVAYGFNKIVKTIPDTNTDGKQQPINKLAELLRSEIAQMGFNEVVNFALCSRDENFTFLGKKDDGSAVTIANPKTLEFQVCRTSLIPGVLKTLANSKGHHIPMRVFELQDIVTKRTDNDVGAGNTRNLSIAYCGHTSGFEFVHGALDRVFAMLRIPLDANREGKKGYFVKPIENGTFFPKRCANIYFNGKVIGIMGIVHPQVLENFEIPYPTSILEINVEPFLDW